MSLLWASASTSSLQPPRSRTRAAAATWTQTSVRATSCSAFHRKTGGRSLHRRRRRRPQLTAATEKSAFPWISLERPNSSSNQPEGTSSTPSALFPVANLCDSMITSGHPTRQRRSALPPRRRNPLQLLEPSRPLERHRERSRRRVMNRTILGTTR